MGLPSRPDSDIIRQLAAWRRPLTRAPEGEAWYAFEPGEPPRCPALDERRSSPRDANGRRSSARPCNRALHFANANTITVVRVQSATAIALPLPEVLGGTYDCHRCSAKLDVQHLTVAQYAALRLALGLR